MSFGIDKILGEIKKMTSSYLATASGIISLVFSFWMKTFNVIIGQMATNLNAALFVYSIGALFAVGCYNVAKGRNIASGRFSRRNQWTMLALILFVTVGLQPYLIQNQYNVGSLDLYAGSGTAEDMTIADHTTVLYYYNTTGDWINTGLLSETQTGDGQFTVDLAPVSQDTDKLVRFNFYWATSSTESDTWNVTAFDQDTDDHIVAIGLRVTTADEGKPLTARFWISGIPSELFSTTIYTSDTDLNMMYLSTYMYNLIDDYATQIAAGNGNIYFILEEQDADQLTTHTDMEIEIHFYAETASTTFDQYLFGAACINFLIALGMTASWNPLANKRRGYRGVQSYRPRRRRFRRYRRSYKRWRGRYSRYRRRRYRRY